MKVDTTLLIGAAIVVVLTIALFMLPPSPQKKPKVETPANSENPLSIPTDSGGFGMLILTDNKTYQEKSRVHITLNVTVPQDYEEAEIAVYGIKNKYGEYMVNKTDTMRLVRGVNTILMTEKLPSCSSCSGLKPGAYNLTGSVFVNGTHIIEASVQINITEED